MDNLEISKRIDSEMLQVFGDSQLKGFEKAAKLASGIDVLRTLLSDEYMKDIMKLQGSKLGFRTDKDRKPDGSKGDGYPVEIVRDVLIEATLIGLEPVGNHFNIIGGNMYVTKEGAEYLLNKESVRPILRFGPTKIDQQGKVARLDVEVEWTQDGKKNKEIVPLSTKWNAYTTEDAIHGKATRKARVWLYNRIHNTQISDGDIQDIPHQEITDLASLENLEEMFLELAELMTEKELKLAKDIIENRRKKDYKRLYDFMLEVKVREGAGS